MNVTPKLGLRKPEDTDYYDITDFNYNMDILDAAGQATSLVAGEVQQTPTVRNVVLARKVGQQHQRVMSDYEGIVPEMVYDAVEFLCEQYDLTLDECRVMYMLQGRVKAEILEPYQQYYKVIVIPMATVPTNSAIEVYSSTDPLYEDELFYTVRRSTGTMYYIDADAVNGFDPESAPYGEATSSSGSYTILKAFHNCYLNNNGSKQHWLPMKCNVTFDPSIIIAYYDDVEFLTV